MRKIFFILTIPLIFACTSESTESNSNIPETNTSNSEILLTNKQIELAKIKTEKIKPLTISETVECTGFIEVPPKQKASVSPIINGSIKSLNYRVGDKVVKGAVLATLQHPDLISLQEEYINTKSQKEYYKEEYKRQGELTIENAASIKKLQKSKADFLSSEAKYKSLKSQLEILGINTQEIEKGEFAKEFKLIAPLGGIISAVKGNTGKFANSQDYIYEIIDNSQLNLNFNIFEKDLSKIKKGQKVIFRILNSNKKYQSAVYRIGAKINTENRTTLMSGKYNNKNSELKPGMHINGTILVNEKEVSSIPSVAIVEDENNFFVFVKKGNQFKKVKIIKGLDYKDNSEIINASEELINSEIVTNGAYYLMSAYKLNE